MRMNLSSATVALLAMVVIACAEEAPQVAADPDMTGERFFDSAATRFMNENPGMLRTQANCMVKAMTADGKIGLGEINGMALDMKGLQEIPMLRDAYYAAVKDCT